MKRALAIMALLAASCSQANEAVCQPEDYAVPKTPDKWNEQIESAGACVRHWSKVYAKVRESAGDVADAALGQCNVFFVNLAVLGKRQPEAAVGKVTSDVWRAQYRRDALIAVFDYRGAGCGGM
ncbi:MULTISPECIES: hypothetical protein [Sphingomonas]|uniref:hypothetical protein n=1 Tax=Sphingomonas TaxID=13687 RepID=UPI00126A0EB5|nr:MULTISPECIES: hypothetical protein [Sphingomonas]